MKKIIIVLTASLLAISPLFSNEKSEKKSYKELELFNKALYLIENNYYKEVNTEDLIKGAIKGMLDSLDPHSTYLDEDLFEKMKNDTSGEFGGVGIEVSFKDGALYIITTIDDTPAFQSGLQAGDKIVEINKENALGLRLDEAIDKMKGKVGEVLHLGVRRDGVEDVINVTLQRKIIKIKPVKSELLEDKYLFLRLTQFQSNSTDYLEKVMKKYLEKKDNKIEGIILDLRSNPGGLLDEAVGVSSLFLKKGVVVSTESRDPSIKDIRYVRKSGFKDLETPVVVLVNSSSASASEIVAGALQDHHRATIMGEQSFGKGTVQSVTPIDAKRAIKLTISQYLTPLKRKIHHIGIKPDISLDETDKEIMDKLLGEKAKKLKKDSKNVEFRKKSIEEDYQVQMAVNYFKSNLYLKNIKKSSIQ
ncbi:MAG: S41 family peptidase [Halobacteriovoraceae bacterium]|nr:S41 family peptidase [Halobacteriovoraceae bacterium]MCB9093973.1 S41 family peptidase [Halobacteriovoraceae bacterium]